VPRIQALAMNEAARMVEEGVASAEDIDKAIKYGFGFRFAVLGLLEFIDWGGGDILYYASRYLTGALGSERYAAPEIVERNMAEGAAGCATARVSRLRRARCRGLPARAAEGVRRVARAFRAEPAAVLYRIRCAPSCGGRCGGGLEGCARPHPRFARHPFETAELRRSSG
jgi:3-hydroxyacyl-CoA dehydrogenase